MISPFLHSTLLGRMWRWRTGLDKLIDAKRFERKLPGNTTWSLLWRKAVPAGMFLPVKYWPVRDPSKCDQIRHAATHTHSHAHTCRLPLAADGSAPPQRTWPLPPCAQSHRRVLQVDAYFDFYRTHKAHMLESNVLLNDIYFFIKLGLVKLFTRTEVIGIGDGKYRCSDGTQIKPDLVLKSQRARRRVLPIDIDGRAINPRYEDYLYGIWSVQTPTLYLLGGTRPTTGAFGGMGEMASFLVHDLILDSEVRQRVTNDFGTLHYEWQQ